MFDEVLIFNKKNVDKELFEQETIRIECFDTDSRPLFPNRLIGSFSVDSTIVYTMNKQHELYRK